MFILRILKFLTIEIELRVLAINSVMEVRLPCHDVPRDAKLAFRVDYLVVR